MALLEITEWLKERIVNVSDGHAEKTEDFLLCKADNSEFLKFVRYILGKCGKNGKSK